jgi:hypothetical protein
MLRKEKCIGELSEEEYKQLMQKIDGLTTIKPTQALPSRTSDTCIGDLSPAQRNQLVAHHSRFFQLPLADTNSHKKDHTIKARL